MSFKAKIENSNAQFLNWLAVKPLKLEAIFDGILPILEGTFILSTICCNTVKSFSSSKLNSSQVFSIFFVVPSNKLCIGSITTPEMKSKYGRWIKDENRTTCLASISLHCFLVVAVFCILHTGSLWSILVRKLQLSLSNPEKSCFSKIVHTLVTALCC